MFLSANVSARELNTVEQNAFSLWASASEKFGGTNAWEGLHSRLAAGENSESYVCIVDQSNWMFVFSNSSPISDALGTSKSPRVLAFNTSTELVRHMADDDQDDYVRIQGRIDERIKADPVARAWKKAQTRLKDLKHFPRYRKNESHLYHDAARARQHGRATPKQRDLANGLEAEINASRVVVPPRQILFHGRADRNLTNLVPFPSFISTSLNPVVARMSAFRRARVNRVNGKPTVYILTLGCSLPALWGQKGKSVEYELLLPPLLTSVVKSQYAGRNFDVVEAEVLR